jgi:CheY-like chemotaxis protein
MLGPIEDALQRGEPLGGEPLRAVHRSTVRLFRLVNSLLDFSRLEAGRLRPTFEPTNLAELTAGLAGSFHSVIVSAGMRLVVDCPPTRAPAYVDRALWEKIVLNLVSNAFKFTLEGEIAVRLRERDGRVELSVSDTGTGIPEHEQARVFERFHRVEGARGRSFEGSGIGLALVREFAQLHGGTVRVESAVGRGTTFTVSLPAGSDHLPKDRIAEAAGPASGDAGATPFVLEASQWVPADGSPQAAKQPSRGATATATASASAAEEAPAQRQRVLVVDDNADMRTYVVGLLSRHWTVDAAADGEAALALIRETPPDLVISDVMMPGMDGYALLRALRDLAGDARPARRAAVGPRGRTGGRRGPRGRRGEQPPQTLLGARAPDARAREPRGRPRARKRTARERGAAPAGRGAVPSDAEDGGRRAPRRRHRP